MSIINSLSAWQWIVILAVPPAIVALYFLKLKRQPLEVPSTYLWSRTIEDLHVNSIWQRLRQSLLLLLQLLLVALLIFACLRPGWRGTSLVGDRFIFLIDNSASMNATDVQPSRLEAAREQVIALIDQMKTGDVAMVVSFSDTPDVVQSFTENRALLRQSVSHIEPTNRRSSLRGALRVAAGRANPGRTSDSDNAADIQVADPMPATMYLYTDGGFSAVPNFSLGNLEPLYIAVGSESPKNLAVETIEQHYFTVDNDKKYELLVRLLIREKPHQAIIFCRTKRGTERLYQRLSKLTKRVECIHGDMPQSGRDRVMRMLREGKLRLLVATDVVGRGIDVTAISHIINYDIPQFCDDYVHRVGRTGRMGSEGIAFTFVAPEEGTELTRIEQRINQLLKRDEIRGIETSRTEPEESLSDDDEATEDSPPPKPFSSRRRRYRRGL